MTSAVVVDTMIASAWLEQRHSDRKARWTPLLESVAWVLPFTVVAEMRFGAEVARWGARRRAVLGRLVARAVLGRLVARAGTVPPLPEVTDAYVDLRTGASAPAMASVPRTTKPTGGSPPSPSLRICPWPARTRSSTK